MVRWLIFLEHICPPSTNSPLFTFNIWNTWQKREWSFLDLCDIFTAALTVSHKTGELKYNQTANVCYNVQMALLTNTSIFVNTAHLHIYAHIAHVSHRLVLNMWEGALDYLKWPNLIPTLDTSLLSWKMKLRVNGKCIFFCLRALQVFFFLFYGIFHFLFALPLPYCLGVNETHSERYNLQIESDTFFEGFCVQRMKGIKISLVRAPCNLPCWHQWLQITNLLYNHDLWLWALLYDLVLLM